MSEATTSILKRRTEGDEELFKIKKEVIRLEDPSNRQTVSQEWDALEFTKSLDSETLDQKKARGLNCSTYFATLLNEGLPEKPTRKFVKMCTETEEMEDVLVEWKGYDQRHVSRDEIIRRVSDVVAIMNSPPSFLHNVLPSLGFFEDPRYNNSTLKWVGIVYRTSFLGARIKFRTLQSLLERSPQDNKSFKTIPHLVWKPPLGDRFQLALRLAETLLSIHNCGWFHKGLRPDNIGFFTSGQKSVRDPFLLGWEYSRSGQKGQCTENVLSWSGEADLYRHPGYDAEHLPENDGDEVTREGRFRAEFDQYALGCVLLEIGMWRRLTDLAGAGRMMANPDVELREQWRLRLKDKAEKLLMDMGEVYSRVVLNLLCGLDADGRGADFWDTVVLQLSRCHV